MDDLLTLNANIWRTNRDTNLRFSANKSVKKMRVIRFLAKIPQFKPFTARKQHLKIDHFFVISRHSVIKLTMISLCNMMQTLDNYVGW